MLFMNKEAPNELSEAATLDSSTVANGDLLLINDVSDNNEWKTIRYDELVIEIGGTAVTATAAEINYLDITTLGTGAASKAVVLDSNSDYTFPAAATIVMPSGGDFTFSSGSTLDVAGTFEIANVAMTASAAELNYLDIATLGTGAASKAVVLDAGDDYTWPATGVLTYGSTGITANGAELNLLDNVAANYTVTFAAGASNVLTLTITAKDAAGATIAAVHVIDYYNSTSSTGANVSTTAYSGTLVATTGAILDTVLDKHHFILLTDANGVFVGSLTDTAKTQNEYHVAIKPVGTRVTVSAATVTGSYGA